MFRSKRPGSLAAKLLLGIHVLSLVYWRLNTDINVRMYDITVIIFIIALSYRVGGVGERGGWLSRVLFMNTITHNLGVMELMIKRGLSHCTVLVLERML